MQRNLRRLHIAFVLMIAALAVVAFPGTSLANGSDRWQNYPPNNYGSSYGCWYQVHFGDTLSGIAVRYGTSVFGLMQANGLQNPNRIFAGMALRVPCAASGYPPACAPAVYIVQPGENLFRIGLRYGFNVNTLAYYNGLRNVNLIFAGMRLLIPCGYGNAATPYPMPTLSSTPGATPPSTGQTTIAIQNFAFNPATVTVHVGATVAWRNDDSAPHTSTSGACPGGACTPNGMWDSGTLNPGQSFSRVFNTAGTYTYYCKIHGASMQGTVMVMP
jgi:plastocyanin